MSGYQHHQHNQHQRNNMQGPQPSYSQSQSASHDPSLTAKQQRGGIRGYDDEDEKLQQQSHLNPNDSMMRHQRSHSSNSQNSQNSSQQQQQQLQQSQQQQHSGLMRPQMQQMPQSMHNYAKSQPNSYVFFYLFAKFV